MKRLSILLVSFIVLVAGDSLAVESTPDSLTLKGDKDGTAFGSLRIEGEDRVRVSFERPDLGLTLDPRSAPGLDWEGIYSALARGSMSALDPLWYSSATHSPQTRVYPWIEVFQHDSVARFKPAVDNVARWSLNIASQTGETVARFSGDGKPPKEIAWDGRTSDGSYAPPGYTYSYVLEAYDKAGNKRTFVGDGFELSAYRVETGKASILMLAGADLITPAQIRPLAVFEAASWINRSNDDQAIDIAVTARSYADGEDTVERLTKMLRPLLLGNPLRVQTRVVVATHAPEHGTVAIHIAKAVSP